MSKATHHRQRRDMPHSRRRRKIALTVCERDGWTCWLCGDPVYPNLPLNHPMQVSMDHVLPLRDGGRFVVANLRLSHRVCNEKRGAELNGHSHGGQVQP